MNVSDHGQDSPMRSGLEIWLDYGDPDDAELVRGLKQAADLEGVDLVDYIRNTLALSLFPKRDVWA